MTNTEKMAALLRAIRTSTNGAVVGAMEARDVAYALSYGVSAADIRTAVAPYAPDHGLAGLLYRQQVRELRIAATLVADSAQITADDLGFLAGGITSAELAEHMAMLLGNAPVVGQTIERWTGTGNPLLVYAALLSGAHAVLKQPDVAARWDFKVLGALILTAVAMRDYRVDKGVVALLGRLWERIPASREALAGAVEELRSGRYPSLWSELEWRME